MIIMLADGTPAFNGRNVIAMSPVIGSTDRVMVAEHWHSDMYGHSYVTFVCGAEDTAEWFSGTYFDASPYMTTTQAREAALMRMVDRSGVRKLWDDVRVGNGTAI